MFSEKDKVQKLLDVYGKHCEAMFVAKDCPLLVTLAQTTICNFLICIFLIVYGYVY